MEVEVPGTPNKHLSEYMPLNWSEPMNLYFE
jgi:hypothetical protein